MKTWLKGGLIGLIIVFLIFTSFWVIAAKERYEHKNYIYEKFELCKPCNFQLPFQTEYSKNYMGNIGIVDSKDLDCIIEKCKQYHTKEYLDRPLTMSLESWLKTTCTGSRFIKRPDIFIYSFCSIDKNGNFIHGSKPTIFNTIFDYWTFEDILERVSYFGLMTGGLGFILLLSPIILGIIIGLIIQKIKK